MLRFTPYPPISAIALGTGAAILSPLVSFAPAFAQTTFSDVSADYWARPFIQRLAREDVITGFPDGTFKPNQPVTRAQFAAIVRKAFDKKIIRNNQSFRDVALNYWAAPAIEKAYTTGFVSGYPDNTFRPEDNIPKVQAIIALASGLQVDPEGDLEKTLSTYRDADAIPDYARKGIAAATQKQMVVNYPNVNFLNPNSTATRADIAAFVYQALVNEGEIESLGSKAQATSYIVAYAPPTSAQPSPDTSPTKPAANANRLLARGTSFPVSMPGGNNVKLIIAPGETVQTDLQLASPILNSNGNVIVPKGAKIQGRFQPVNISGSTAKGTQYYATKMTVGDKVYTINATSDLIVPTAQQAVAPQDLRGSLATAGARILLGQLLGGGTNIGNLLGGLLTSGGTASPLPTQQSNAILVVDPSQLNLTLQNDVQLASMRVQPSIALTLPQQ